MPINILDFHYRSFQNEVVPVCLEKGVGVIGMKSLAGQGLLPEQTGVSVQNCIRYALGLPIASLVVGIASMVDLEQDLKIARDFKPMALDEQEKLREKVKDRATDGRHELFKSTQTFDGPHHRRQHGFATD